MFRMVLNTSFNENEPVRSVAQKKRLTAFSGPTWIGLSSVAGYLSGGYDLPTYALVRRLPSCTNAGSPEPQAETSPHVAPGTDDADFACTIR